MMPVDTFMKRNGKNGMFVAYSRSEEDKPYYRQKSYREPNISEKNLMVEGSNKPPHYKRREK
jgi:hypothetical protein